MLAIFSCAVTRVTAFFSDLERAIRRPITINSNGLFIMLAQNVHEHFRSLKSISSGSVREYLAINTVKK
jgi:hypothetical protein